MFVEVTRLRLQGMRLKGSELPPSTSGYLSVISESGAGLSFKRPIMIARLVRKHASVASGMVMEVLQPLFDVRLIGIEDGRVTLQGVELDSRDGRMFETMQIWRCRPISEMHRVVLRPEEDAVGEPGSGLVAHNA